MATRKLLEKKRQRLSELKAAQGQGTALATQVRAADEHLLHLSSRLTEARDDQRSEFPGFRVLARAEPPTEPKPSRAGLLVFVIPLLLVSVTGAALLLRALWGMRVHTAREAGFWVNGPVVTTSAWPRKPESLPFLVADVNDAVAESAGTTLVVGATRREASFARQVAGWVGSEPPPARRDDNASALALAGQAMVVHGEIDDVATARPASEARDGEAVPLPVVRAWRGELSGEAVRRAARLADRVLVILSSGTCSVNQAARIRASLGREQGVGVMLLDASDAVCALPDRVGDVERFWRSE